MANTIDTTSHRPPSSWTSPPSRHLTLDQKSLASRSSDITLTTAEGDVVTIAGASTMATAMNFEKIEDEVGVRQSFTSRMLSAESFSLSIQGDLSEEELRDIGALVQDLRKIADTFFQGDSGKALDQAMKLDGGSTIAGFSASFQFSLSEMTSLTTNHPLPELPAYSLASLQDITPDVTGMPAEETSYTDRLRAQWEQVLRYLDEHLAQPAPKATQAIDGKSLPPEPSPPASPPGQAMMDRVRETVARHPRLSPFIQPLFEKALTESANQAQSSGKEQQHMDRQLRSSFQREIQNWLYLS